MYMHKWLHVRHCVLKHMTAHETRGFLPSNGFKLVCVSWRHAVFSGSLQLLKTTWNTKQSMNYTEWTASQLSVFASKGCIYFTCQKTDFHFLGDILMWFKSGVEILFGMWHHWINIKLSQIFKWVLLMDISGFLWKCKPSLELGRFHAKGLQGYVSTIKFLGKQNRTHECPGYFCI